ncbi:unnamed protein product [Sphagnum troendelagicum]|uniref:Uncharacterized protein n=1 Tax=Sphagnum troendelagicum TaxID=128251 RepID=A0ABP0TDF3_9BRYO
MVMKKVKQMSGVHIDELLNRVERVEWVVVKELMQSAANSDRQVNRWIQGIWKKSSSNMRICCSRRGQKRNLQDMVNRRIKSSVICLQTLKQEILGGEEFCYLQEAHAAQLKEGVNFLAAKPGLVMTQKQNMKEALQACEEKLTAAMEENKSLKERLSTRACKKARCAKPPPATGGFDCK